MQKQRLAGSNMKTDAPTLKSIEKIGNRLVRVSEPLRWNFALLSHFSDL
jgi:hypothetical protein